MSQLEAIVRACGGTLYAGGTRALIPGPGHGNQDRSVSLALDARGGLLIHCFSPRDDWRAVRDHLRALGVLEDAARGDRRVAPSPSMPICAARLLRARRLWDEACPIAGSLSETYLRARAITRPLLPANLRHHSLMTSLEDRRRRPALLAAIHDRDDQIQGVQITLLAPDGGGKARLSVPRRIVGHAKHGAVRLDPVAACMIIAEGVETALSAAHSLGHPAWAALSAYNLARFAAPPNVTRLFIAADDDETGRAAAATLAARLSEVLRIETLYPGAGRKDWNDRARAQARA